MASHRGAVKVPKYNDFHWPVIRALKETGGSASIAELYEQVVADMNLGEDVLAVPHGDGTTSEVEYRLAWARTYLKKVGAIDNSERGVWALTSKGRAFTEKDAADVVNRSGVNFVSRPAGNSSVGRNGGQSGRSGDQLEGKFARCFEVDVTSRVRAFKSADLRESGFTKVEVQGRSGDGGIDGAGVLRMNLVSFHVLFQCKRWKDAVSAPVVRDFRGAMIGRADKGLIITTGRFTSEAQREAVRDGAPAIDLVDGETLCELLKNLRLGVEVRSVEVVEIRPDELAGI